MDDNTASQVINQDPDKRERKQEGLEDIHDNSRNAGVLSNETGSCVTERKQKKMKRDRLGEMRKGKNDKENLEETTVNGDEKKPKKSRRDGLEENDGRNKKDLTLARGTSPRQLKVSDKMSNPEAVNSGIELEENVTELDRLWTSEIEGKEEEGSNSANSKNFLKNQNADIPLPEGTELTSVAGIDVCAEDVGNALQFLEFCSVFGKASDFVYIVTANGHLV